MRVINTKIFLRLGLLFAVAMSLLAGLPFSVFAQTEKTVLTMNVLYGNFNNTVKAGQDNIIYFQVGNGGNVSLNHIVFTALVPEGWTVTFNPDSIESLGPGAYTTVEANVRPAGSGERDNTISFIARSNETQQVLPVYTQLESTSGYWIWIGSGIAAVCIAVFIWVFFRLNRKQT